MTRKFRNFLSLFKRAPKRTFNFNPSIDYSGAYKADGIFDDEFYFNLKKTMAWTEQIIANITDHSNINYSKVLRTTNPIYDAKPFYTFEDTVLSCASSPQFNFNYNVVLTEALVLRQGNLFPNKSPESLGRILKFQIDISTRDGAPCAEHGFVDDSDIPPIDTWFYVTAKYLYCWIPAMFINVMQRAIDVEILESYEWLDETDPDFYIRILKRVQQNA